MYLALSEQLVQEHVAELRRSAARSRRATRADNAPTRAHRTRLHLPAFHRAPSAIGCQA